MNYDTTANKESLEKTVKSLEEKGYSVSVVDKGTDALEKIKSVIPKGSSVMNGSSVTLETIGYPEYLKSEGTGWVDFHSKVNSESDPQKRKEIRKEATMSDYYLGSVHALAETGEFVIASNTGSQLPHIAFTSPNLIFVIGTQKIVPTLPDALKRLTDYVYPLENKHMMGKYNIGTNISKILIFNKENPMMGRKVNIILVKEKLGF